MDVGVTSPLDEMGVGAMVDATGAEGKKIYIYGHINLNLICQTRKKRTPPKLQLIVWDVSFIRHCF